MHEILHIIISYCSLCPAIGRTSAPLAHPVEYHWPRRKLCVNHSKTTYMIYPELHLVGVYSSGPVWGRVVDTKGNRIPLIGAFTCLLFGYLGIRRMYDDGATDTVSLVHLGILILCSCMTGVAGNAGLSVAINTTAKSFPDTAVCFPCASLSHADKIGSTAWHHNRACSFWFWPICILLCHNC
jgi:hypothetical protein